MGNYYNIRRSECAPFCLVFAVPFRRADRKNGAPGACTRLHLGLAIVPVGLGGEGMVVVSACFVGCKRGKWWDG